MQVMRTLSLCVGAAVFLAAHGPAQSQEQQYIAGLAPSVRPPAPVLTDYPKPQAWYVAALRGVEPPYPPSLVFLDSQGAWFQPFIHPGMTGPYDLRGWHVKANSSAN